MKYPALLTFDEILPQLQQYDSIIDVRSPSEFADDHIPGAINCPVLSDEERHEVGTIYKQQDAFEAKKIGAAHAARNIAAHIDGLFRSKPKDWQPLVYCWRGGNRSGSLAHILAKIGWRVTQLDGGYKNYRRHVLQALDENPGQLRFKVVCGPTGTGKSRLLQALAGQGAQVLDLEQIACHKGSVLGGLPTASQPAQKLFESRLWQALRAFDSNRVVYVESESKKVGNLRVPDELMKAIRSSACMTLQLDMEERIKLLMEEYQHFVVAPDKLAMQLDRLVQLYGQETISTWKAMARDGKLAELTQQLLEKHYDPSYSKSIQKNFLQLSEGENVYVEDSSLQCFDALAEKLLRQEK